MLHEPDVAVLLLLALSPLGCAGPTGSSAQSPAATTAMTSVHHTIDYIELTVLDVAEAQRFYGDAFGWTFNDYGPDYAGIQRAGGGEVGGLRRDDEVVTGGPLVVLFSEDLEASVESVRRAGGRIVQQIFAFPGGRRFHFEDPFGNVLAVYAVTSE